MPILPDDPIFKEELANALAKLTPAQIEFVSEVIKNFFSIDDSEETTEQPSAEVTSESPHIIFARLITTYSLLNPQHQAFLAALQTLQATDTEKAFCPSWIKKAWDTTGCTAIYNIEDLSFVSVFVPAMFEYLSTDQSAILAQFNEKLIQYAASVQDQIKIRNYLHFYLAETLSQAIEGIYQETPSRFDDAIFQHVLSLIPFASINALMHFTQLFYQLLSNEKDADTRTTLVQNVFSLCHRHHVTEIFQEGGQLFQLQLLTFYIILIYEDLDYSFDTNHTELLRKITANLFSAFKAKRSTLPEKILILLQQIESKTLPRAVDAIVNRTQTLSL